MSIEFGARLRSLRESAGLSQAELAKKIGIHVMSLSRYERGEREPDWSGVKAICAALGVNCLAFDVEPAGQTEPRPKGRPKKSSE